MAKGDLEIMQEMVSGNMDIVACTTMVRADKNKIGGTVAMGVPEPMFSKFILEGGYIPVLYLVNAKQFFELKKVA